MPRLSLRADAGVGAVAVSPTSRDTVLAGRSGLYIVDLHDPFALPRWLPLRSAWEVSSVQWCPHSHRPACLVSSSNQKALVWNLVLPSDRAVEHVLHGHRRAITDIYFSPKHPDQLATASIDTTIKIWDLRHIGTPAMTFADFHAGAIQTRWSSSDENQIASAHDNRIVLWDKRRANLPVVNIQAHQGECNGLQFLANGRLLTCSTDRTIKIWDFKNALQNDTNEISPELTIEAGFPVWRALPTPFELGALVVPLRGGNNKMSLINLARQSGTKTLADVQVGDAGYQHPDSVRNAVFMRSDNSTSHYDVVTWCHDSHLRVWNGGILQDLPHASSAAGCKDDEPPELPSDRQTFNTSDFDNIASSTQALNAQDVFDLPLLNRRRKDEAHAIGHLDWIAGVRLDQNHVGSADCPRRGRRGGDSSGDFVNSSEQLSQEIISVSSRFPKVLFDDINIGSGSCDISLNGPWGPDHSVVRVRINVRIPHDYPYLPMKIVVIDDSDMREGAAEEVTAKLAETSSELSRHGVQALEFSVRYLVGDPVSIEDSLAGEIIDFGQLDEAENSSAEPERHELANAADDEGDFIEFSDDENSDTDSAMGDNGDVFAIGDNNDESSSATDDDSDSNIDRKPRDINRDAIIDSTPVPKNCGAVWSPTGFLICFFNRKPAGKDKGPLPLDKVFADDSRSDDSNAPFLSDSEDFEQELPKAILKTTANWSITAAQLTANPSISTNPNSNSAAAAAAAAAAATSGTASATNGMMMPVTSSGGIGGSGAGAGIFGRNRSRTLTSLTSDERSTSPRQSVSTIASHTIVVKNMLHMWPCRPDLAAEYIVYMSGEPLEVVEHNAKVAAKYQLWEDENIWRIIHAYISVEEKECKDPNSLLTTADTKFDWCGGYTGLRSFFPEVATYLEQKGNIQLLACISLVFSALRGRRVYLRHITRMSNPPPDPLAVIEPEVESVFQTHPDGTISLIADHRTNHRPNHRHDNASINSRDTTPTEHAGSANTHSDSTWPDQDPPPSLPFNAYDASSRNIEHTMLTASSRRSSQVVPTLHQHETHHHQSQGNGPLIGVEINNEVFDFDYRPTSFIVAHQESTADHDFVTWLPRLVKYRLQYASLLQIWGLNITRAETSKLNPFDSLILNQKNIINKVRQKQDEWIDIEMSKNAPCSLCNSPVTRLFEYCEQCTHVMHSTCAQQWWEFEHECPSACGCECKKYVT